MSKKILYFEGAGSNTPESRDMENCRVRTAFYNNDGKAIYLELLEGCKVDVRKTHKVTGKELKHPIITRTPGYMFVDFCHYITEDKDDCNESRVKDAEGKSVERSGMNFEYTKESVLKWINETLNCSFEDIKVLPWLSGYYVFNKEKALYGKYYMMDDFVDIPERTAERQRIMNVVAKEYFRPIYEAHVKANPNKAYLYKPNGYNESLVSYDDSSITIRSHTYKELIDEDQRVHTFEVKY